MLYHLTEPAVLLGIVVGLVIGVYAHSAAQTLAAAAMGDPTPRGAGRLAPKPAQTTDVYSAVAMVIVGFGWVLPVPMNDRWRARRWRVTAALAAGPVALALLALGVLALLRVTATTVMRTQTTLGLAHSVRIVHGDFLALVLLWVAYTLCALAIVSLIPLPPTSGGRALFLLGGTSPGWQRAYYQLAERNIGLAVLLALLLLPVLLGGFPSVVGQLAPALLHGLSTAVGL